MTWLLYAAAIVAAFGIGWLAGERHEQRAELARMLARKRRQQERGAITLDVMAWVWAALALWAVGLLAVWWWGS